MTDTYDPFVTPLRAQCEAIWHTAATASIGIVVECSDSRRAQTALYNFRREIEDPSLAKLSIRVSPDRPDTELWIFRDLDELRREYSSEFAQATIKQLGVQL